jgi:hypothetical protein
MTGEETMAGTVTANKTFTFGTSAYERTSPSRVDLSPQTKVINILVSFEDALKFNVAVDECVRKLNSYKMSTKAGKRAALNVTVYLDRNRIAVNEGKLKDPAKKE